MKALFTLFFLFFITNTYSQKEDYIIIHGTVTDTTDIALKDVSVKIKRNNIVLLSVKTDSNGNFKLDSLGLNQTYEIHFYKKGYCYKYATLFAHDLSSSGEFYGAFPMEVNVSLFKIRGLKKFRLRFMRKEPAAKARYNSKTDSFEWDMDYIQTFQERVGRIID